MLFQFAFSHITAIVHITNIQKETARTHMDILSSLNLKQQTFHSIMIFLVSNLKPAS